LADPGSPGRRVIERVPDVTLDVRPQPAEAASPWLPAASLELADEWDDASPRFEVGEPVARRLVIMAVGLTSAQLPSLPIETTEGVQMYPGAERTEDLQGSAGPIALRTQEVTLVPTRAGPLTLPEIRLPWWDTGSDVARVAVIPARTIEVAGAAATDDVGVGDSVAAPADADATEAGDWRRSLGRWLVEQPPLVRWAGALAVLLLVVVGLLAWMRRRSGPSPSDAQEARGAARTTRQRLQRACLAGDAREARAALLAWARVAWRDDPPQGLGALARRLEDDAIGEPLADLERALYAGPAAAWDGVAAWRALEPALSAVERASRQTRAASRSSSALPALYPPRV
jgi:hypothetical protein